MPPAIEASKVSWAAGRFLPPASSQHQLGQIACHMAHAATSQRGHIDPSPGY